MQKPHKNKENRNILTNRDSLEAAAEQGRIFEAISSSHVPFLFMHKVCRSQVQDYFKFQGLVYNTRLQIILEKFM